MAAIDIRKLRPTDVCKLLNSTSAGEVINERQLHRHRVRAGFRIGDGRHVDLFRYVAWLVEERHRPRPETPTDPYGYLKEKARARNAALSLAGRDIGELPEVANPERKERAERDFRSFCNSYFPGTFHLPWSSDHLKVIGKVEEAVLNGGLFAMAMPRGTGKALALDTPLVTPWGWTTMGDVQVGDYLFDEEGWPCRVTYATEVQLGRPCYRVWFSDGESIVCDADHLWTVEDRWSRRNPLTLATEDMRDRVVLPHTRSQSERRYRVRIPQPLRLPEASLEVDPYVLGYWLGDGSRRSNRIAVHTDDLPEVAAELRRCGETCDIQAQKGSVTTCVVGKGHGANPQKARRIQAALAGLSCHVPTACVLGSEADTEWVRSLMPVALRRDRLDEYETPTLQLLWEWCRSNPSGCALYCHTKGVSAPQEKGKAAWRRLMALYVVEHWQENVEKLKRADMVGVDWQDLPDMPHFSGNFWMARADWIANLPSPVEHRDRGGPVIMGHPWARMHAEMWLGSRPWHHIESLCCRNENVWSGPRVFELLGETIL